MYLKGMTQLRRYPDLKDLFAKKAGGRAERAKATIVEKLDALDQLRARTKPIVSAKRARETKMKQ
jgi:hypothetical protein